MLRTHNCGELRKDHAGTQVTLAGWVHSIRTHGALTFIDLKDRYGITQITVKDLSEQISKESVIQVKGEVIAKPESNKNLATGDIEISATELKVLNKAKPLPLDANATEETRLKYRYLDLRSEHMQKNLLLRHKAALAVREYFNKLDFIEIETPVLGKSTPEGARDYLVPSRVNQGKFFALPQSPQIFKQLFQVAGLDRYLQITKCFRDEDLRADRQPEFTQIDLEMSFVDQEDIYSIMEGMITHVWKETIGEELKTPFPRIPYDEAMLKYGSDKPDLRFDLEIQEQTEWATNTDFKVFTSASCVRSLTVNHLFSRKEVDKLTDVVKIYGAKGLAWLANDNGELKGSIAKFFPDYKLESGQTIFFVADDTHVVADSLGALRLALGKQLELIRKEWNFVWVTDFPMLEWSEEYSRYVAMHHPFTRPREEDVELLNSAPEKAKAAAYDLTLNGYEIGGGSLRIYERDLQEQVFSALGISKEEQEEKFGFLLNAFTYGAPPHGGLAFGFDRLIMLLCGAQNIREVIAFPKNKDAVDLMMQSPGSVDQNQLNELGLNLKK
jgi:aspartyl-tRNA synthetase